MTKTVATQEPSASSSINRLQPRTIDTGRLARLDADLAAGIDQLNDQVVALIFADEAPSGADAVHQLQLIHRGLGHLNHTLAEHLTRRPESCT